jgi:hypothetical protein
MKTILNENAELRKENTQLKVWTTCTMLTQFEGSQLISISPPKKKKTTA